MRTFNEELINVNNWIASNKLTLNINKTNYITFHRNKIKPINIEPIKIGNSVVKEVESTKFLGITVDKRLSWSLHIQNIKTKINKQCGILSLTRKYFNTNALKIAYYSLVYPNILYCHTVWGASGKTKIKTLEIAQKKVVRTMSYLRRHEHTNSSFYNLGILKLEEINIYCCAIFVYKCLNKFIENKYFQIRIQNRYNLRTINVLHIPLMTSSQSQSCISYHGVKVWNNLPQNIRAMTTLAGFKKSLKSLLLSRYQT